MDIEQLHAEIYYQFAYTIALLEQGKKLSKKDISDISDKIYEIIVSQVEKRVSPACDEQILQAKIDELENWIKYLNWDPTNIIRKSMLMDRVKILENENHKSA